MKTGRYQVLSHEEVERIHHRTLELLKTVGIKVELKKMREKLSDVGCVVEEARKIVKFPNDVVETFRKKAPREIVICGADPEKRWIINPETRIFGGLGTPISIYDLETGKYRPTTLQDQIDHLVLFDHLDNIVSNQMDIWPNDIPMHTIHVEAIRAWARHCTKSFGMGAYGVMATRDMMEMTEMVMGGSENMKDQHPFVTIVSIHSPLATAQAQLEGLMILAEKGQPAMVSPEAMAGTTAPVTLAGLLLQHNAEILAHIVMAQVVNSGTPVMYGTVSTIAEMRRGTVALGAVETGMISSASAQLAHYYDIPCRAVAGGTEAKIVDVQCGLERMQSLIQTALGGANYITCVGTLESTTAAAQELVVIDNELIGMVERMARGIAVDDETLAVEVIRNVGPGGNYLMEQHTQKHFRAEHFIPQWASRDAREIWEEKGRKNMLENARAEARRILSEHQPRELDPKLSDALNQYVETVSQRTIEDFEAAEWEP